MATGSVSNTSLKRKGALNPVAQENIPAEILKDPELLARWHEMEGQEAEKRRQQNLLTLQGQQFAELKKKINDAVKKAAELKVAWKTEINQQKCY